MLEIQLWVWLLLLCHDEALVSQPSCSGGRPRVHLHPWAQSWGAWEEFIQVTLWPPGGSDAPIHFRCVIGWKNAFGFKMQTCLLLCSYHPTFSISKDLIRGDQVPPLPLILSIITCPANSLIHFLNLCLQEGFFFSVPNWTFNEEKAGNGADTSHCCPISDLPFCPVCKI